MRTVKGIFFVVMALLAGCKSQPRAPERLSGIPNEAVWSGGADGGAWFNSAETKYSDFCTVYNDQTGKVWAQGDFVEEHTRKKIRIKNTDFDFYDGHSIYLKDGRRLIPIKNKVRHPVRKK